MTGPELKQLRHDLGEAIGRRLSVADMAKICGLAPKNGADTWRRWEEGDGPSGPVATLLSLLCWAEGRLTDDRHAYRYPIPDDLLAAAESAVPDKYGADGIVEGQIDDRDCELALRAAMRAEILRRL